MPDLPDSLTRIHPLGFTNLVEVKKLHPCPGQAQPSLETDSPSSQSPFLLLTGARAQGTGSACIECPVEPPQGGEQGHTSLVLI